MNTETEVNDTDSTQPINAVHSLLREIATLCVLGHVTEADALNVFRDELRRVSCVRTTSPYDGVDAFVAGQVLGEWQSNARFLDRHGDPAPLSLSRGQFTTLCQTASARAEEASVLAVLTQAGAAAIDGDTVTASRRELILGFGHPGAVARAIQTVAGLAATLNHNLVRTVRQPSRFERTVVHSKLGQRHLPALLAYLSVHGQSFLQDLDLWMSSRESKQTGPVIGVGLYLFGDNAPN